MLGRLRWLNPIFAIFGLKIIERRIGHWYVAADGTIARTSHHLGWRFGRLSDAVALPDDATELDRFFHTHRSEIASKIVSGVE